MRKIFLKTLLPVVLCTIWVQGMKAQSTLPAYTYVQQNGEVVTKDGCADFDVNSRNITMEFDDQGNGIMYYTDAKSVTIAKLPIANDDNGGQLCAEYENNSGVTAGQVSKTISPAGYSTIYSPFQIVTSGATFYTGKLNGTTDNYRLTLAECSGIVPVCTALLLSGTASTDYTFGFSTEASTATWSSNDLNGTSLKISNPSESNKTLCTLGYSKENSSLFGFFKYNGATISPSTCYLQVPTEGARENIFVALGDEETGIENVNPNVDANHDGKFLVNDRIIIVRNGKKYNVNGQEVK